MNTCLAPLTLLVATGLSACSGPASIDGDSPACSGKCDALSDQPIVAQVARVWLEKGTQADDFFRVDTLRVEPLITDGVTLQSISVNIYLANNSVQGGLVDPSAGAQAIANLNTASYPASIKLDLTPTQGDHDLLGASLAPRLRTAIMVAGPDALPKAEAAIITLPFPIWRVRILARVDRVVLSSQAYEVPLADGWLSGDTGKTVSVDPTTVANLHRDELTTVTLIGPAKDGVRGNGQFLDGAGNRAQLAFAIAGPGDYIAEATGLRRAKAGKIGGATVDMAGTPVDPSVDLAQSPDLASAWPSDCGQEDQGACQSSSGYSGCAPLFVTDYNQHGNNRCHACGSEGEAQCAEPSGNRMCSLGFVMSYNEFGNSRCHACGGDDQYQCNGSAGRFCDGGLVMSYNEFGNTRCHPCGAEDEYACMDATGARACNAGLAVNYNKYGNSRCHAL